MKYIVTTLSTILTQFTVEAESAEAAETLVLIGHAEPNEDSVEIVDSEIQNTVQAEVQPSITEVPAAPTATETPTVIVVGNEVVN